MDAQGRTFPPDKVSFSSATNSSAQRRPRSPRSMVQHRQHPYIRRPSSQKLRKVPENSNFETDTGVGGPVTADQRRFTDTLESSPLTTPNIASSTQPITSTPIPDLTRLITRCSPDPISGGAYGNIYKCIYHGPEGDEEVAVKAIRPQFFSAETFRRELGIWKRLRHYNILKFMGTASGFGPSVALVAPWMTNGTLTSFLNHNNKTLVLLDRLFLLRDIIAGLNYHGHTDLNPVVHGDLTGVRSIIYSIPHISMTSCKTNVLIDGDGKAYLADFGLSGTFEKLIGMTYLAKMTSHPGAVRWAAPELLSGEESASVATTQSDMYSFGSIMLQVLTGNVPWCHLPRDFQIMHQVVNEGKMHPRPHGVYVTDRHWDFMTRCWSMSLAGRPPAEEAVQFVDTALHPDTTLSISSDEQMPSIRPQSPILSISSDERHPGIARDEDAVCAESGCYTCRIRRKKCDEQPNADGSCQTCVRLRLQCLGFGAMFPEWLRTSGKVVDLREKIENFIAAQGMIEGHSGAGPRPNDQEPSILSPSSNYVSPSTSPQTPTLSIPSDERHPGIARNDYLRGDSDARLPVMQDIDSPLDARENYPRVMLPAYPPSTYTTSLEPSWTQSNLPRPHTSDFSATYHISFPDDEEYNVIPSGYLLPQSVPHTIHYNWVNLNTHQNASLQHYMQHVLRIQYSHADGSIDKLIWKLIHSSDSAREAACLLADLHRRSTQGAIGYTAPASHDCTSDTGNGGRRFYEPLHGLLFPFLWGQGQWQAFLDSACEFSIDVLQQNHIAPDWALISCTESMRFIIKTSIWFDVLASATLIRRPKFLDVLRSLYGPTPTVNGGRSELSMMGAMGCENRIVLALAEIADLACWKDECRRAGRLSVSELVRRGQDIETILRSVKANDPDHLYDLDTERSRRQHLTSDVFRASAFVYLHSVISGDHPQCPEIMSNIAETVKCLRRAEDISTARQVVRTVVFSICICGCLTDVPEYREYFLRRLHEQQTETVGNCTRVAQLMKEVWNSREQGEPMDWRTPTSTASMLSPVNIQYTAALVLPQPNMSDDYIMRSAHVRGQPGLYVVLDYIFVTKYSRNGDFVATTGTATLRDGIHDPSYRAETPFGNVPVTIYNRRGSLSEIQRLGQDVLLAEVWIVFLN
ncbi:hypothetical protein BD769DRAFT_1642591 [Suillus cothurnatus]|nr:hypothetical protein BD769DRAFT_1642591 [Suillus cothurnatus]